MCLSNYEGPFEQPHSIGVCKIVDELLLVIIPCSVNPKQTNLILEVRLELIRFRIRVNPNQP